MEKTVIKTIVYTEKPTFKIELDEKEKILLINVKEKPEKGKANKEIIKKLKKIFKSEVKILSGLKSNKKIIEIFLNEEKIINKIKPNSTKIK